MTYLASGLCVLAVALWMGLQFIERDGPWLVTFFSGLLFAGAGVSILIAGHA